MKKGRVDPSPTRLALDSITGALVPFRPLSNPPLASHTLVESIPDFCPSPLAAASIVTGPSSTMEALSPFFDGDKLYVTTSPSNVSILDTTCNNTTTESDGGASSANLGAPVIDGLNAATASTLDALVEDIADDEWDQ